MLRYKYKTSSEDRIQTLTKHYTEHKNSVMKKLLSFSIILLISLGISETASAQWSAGGGLVYGTEVSEIGLQLNGVYEIDEEWRGSADFIYYFVSGNLSISEFNINAHYVFHDEDELTAYGIGGINYLRVSSSFQGFSASGSEIGLNIGAGLEYDLEFANLFAEAKFAISSFDQLVIASGLRFPF